MPGFGLTSFVPSSDNMIYNSCWLGRVGGPLRVATQVPRTLRCRRPCRTGVPREKLSAGPFVWPDWSGGEIQEVTKAPGWLGVMSCALLPGGSVPRGKAVFPLLPNCTPGCVKYCSLLFSLTLWCWAEERQIHLLFSWIRTTQFHKQIGLQLGVLCHK